MRKVFVVLFCLASVALAGLKADIIAQSGLADPAQEASYRSQILDVLTPALKKIQCRYHQGCAGCWNDQIKPSPNHCL